MSEILQSFGVNWTAFLTQCLAFGIVFFILWRFALGPIIAVLEERRRRIAEGMANADKIKQQLADSEVKYRQLLDEAQAKSQKMIDEARASSDSLADRRSQEATTEAERIIARAREATQLEHDRVLNDVKRELGRLVIDTASKVTGKILNDDDQRRLNEETARQVG